MTKQQAKFVIKESLRQFPISMLKRIGNYNGKFLKTGEVYSGKLYEPMVHAVGLSRFKKQLRHRKIKGFPISGPYIILKDLGVNNINPRGSKGTTSRDFHYNRALKMLTDNEIRKAALELMNEVVQDKSIKFDRMHKRLLQYEHI